MKIAMIGVNHETADAAWRERLVLTGPSLDALYTELREHCPGIEAMAMSTCNRSEVYVAVQAERMPSADALTRLLGQSCGLSYDELLPLSVALEGDAAVEHLFHVAAGLQSMVLGEPQILGQVKQAYEDACRRRTVGPALHLVCQRAIAAAKRVRHQTGIGDGRVSVGSVAADFARQIFDHFDDKVIVGIGAGEMTKLMLRHLIKLRPAKLCVTNRTFERAQQLRDMLAEDAGAEIEVVARPFDQLDALLTEADIVMTGTGSPEPIITADRLRPLQRKRRHRPLFIIDIALPRDVEDAVGGLRDAYVYNLDHLQQVVSQNYEQRSSEVAACRAICADAVAATVNDIQHRDVGVLIKELRQKFHAIGEGEQGRTLRKLAAAPPDDVPHLLEEYSRRLINKLLHAPMQALGDRHGDLPVGHYIEALRRLFELQGGESDEAPHEGCEPPASVVTDKNAGTGEIDEAVNNEAACDAGDSSQAACPDPPSPPADDRSSHVEASQGGQVQSFKFVARPGQSTSSQAGQH